MTETQNPNYLDGKDTAGSLGGTVAVILACGAVYLAIGVVGLVRFAGWTESGHSISDLVTKAG